VAPANTAEAGGRRRAAAANDDHERLLTMRRPPHLVRLLTAVGRATLVVGIIGSFWLGLSESAAVASGGQPVPAGVAEVVQPATGGPLTSGTGLTPFTLKLPSGAACPGDTAHKYYLEESYLTPQAMSPAAVRYRGGFPINAVALVTGAGESYVAVNTDVGTGQLRLPPPIFSFRDLIGRTDFPAGTYNIGLACSTEQGVTARYWNARLNFRPRPTVQGDFTWTVLAAPKTSSSGSSWKSLIGIVIALVAVAGVAWLVLMRRRDTPAGSAAKGSNQTSPGPAPARKVR
jgi:hypothetical protein